MTQVVDLEGPAIASGSGIGPGVPGSAGGSGGYVVERGGSGEAPWRVMGPGGRCVGWFEEHGDALGYALAGAPGALGLDSEGCPGGKVSRDVRGLARGMLVADPGLGVERALELAVRVLASSVDRRLDRRYARWAAGRVG